MSSSRGYFDNPLTAGADLAAAKTIVQSERRDLSKGQCIRCECSLLGFWGLPPVQLLTF